MKKWTLLVFSVGLLAAGLATNCPAQSEGIANTGAESGLPQIAGQATIPSDAPVGRALNGSSPAKAAQPPGRGTMILLPNRTDIPRRIWGVNTAPSAPSFGLAIGPKGGVGTEILFPGAGSAQRLPGSITGIGGPGRPPVPGPKGATLP